jgi:hypothetical protein
MVCSKCNHIGSCGNSAVQILCHEVLHKKATSRTRPNCRRVLCNAASTEKSVFGEAFWEEIDRIPQDRQLEDRWYQRLLRGARWAMLEWVEVTLFRRKPLASPKITLFSPLMFHVTLSSGFFSVLSCRHSIVHTSICLQTFPC